MRSQTLNRQRGFGAIAAIVVLLLAALAAAIVSLSSTQQTTITQDTLSARASLAARGGTEWGLFQAFNDATYCTSAPLGGAEPTPTSLPGLAGITGMQVQVSCQSSVYNEGLADDGNARTVRVYQITAVACTSSAPPCPGNAASPAYVERRHRVVAAR